MASGAGATLSVGGRRGVWVLYVVGRLLLPRWPALFVPPAFAYAGYTGW